MIRRPDPTTDWWTVSSVAHRDADEPYQGSDPSSRGIARLETPGDSDCAVRGAPPVPARRSGLAAGMSLRDSAQLCATPRPYNSSGVKRFHGLNEVTGDISGVFDTHGEPNQAVPDAQSPSAFRAELAMSRGSRVRHE